MLLILLEIAISSLLQPTILKHRLDVGFEVRYSDLLEPLVLN